MSEKKQEIEDLKKTAEEKKEESANEVKSSEVKVDKAPDTAQPESDSQSQEASEPSGEVKEEIKKEVTPSEKEGEVVEKKDKEEEKPKTEGKGRRFKRELTREEIVSAWEPKTKLGIEVKNGKVKDLDYILDNNKKILEEQIVDALINVKTDLILIGQAKGKFGGGKRRAWRQTQRKTKAKNIPTFSAMAVMGDENGHVGIGTGKSMETLPARDKATRKAKLNVIKIKRTCSAFDCACSELHTVPFEVTGKAGSVRVKLIPAPQGTGLVVGRELKKVLKLAGIKDVYSKTFGRKRTTFNFVKACFDALKKTNLEEK